MSDWIAASGIWTRCRARLCHYLYPAPMASIRAYGDPPMRTLEPEIAAPGYSRPSSTDIYRFLSPAVMKETEYEAHSRNDCPQDH